MKINSKAVQFVACFSLLCVMSLLASCNAAPLVIAEEGQSTLSIVVPKIAARSVNEAAVEMQRTISEATGAKLPIVKDNETVKGAFISLGSTGQARAAGISAPGIPDEGFCIVTKAGNLYIIGVDTTAIDLDHERGRPGRPGFNVQQFPEIPGPAFTKNGGFSNGTANGVYTFLEDYLDVRWLMPGDIGRDVPRRSTLKINDIDRTDSSPFSYRVISLIGTGPTVLTWSNQLKLGFSFRLDHEHAWSEIVPASLYKEHPDWFAMGPNGERLDPKLNHGKIETTNPELVRYVAEKAAKALKENPALNTFSLSPDDGAGFSQSPESKALQEGPQGPVHKNPSLTPAILKFYSDVSKIVAEKHPQGKVSGYFYSYYTYPPSQGNAKIPDNFVPILTSIASGYGFYQPVMRGENEKLIKEWGKIFPSDWFYYAFPTWMRGIGSKYGVITTAAPEYLNSLFGDLVKNGCKGGFFYGDSANTQSVMSDYITAKMMWNPRADAVALQREWLSRAYGAQAGAIMHEFYQKMDASWFSDYFRGPDSTWHNVSEAFFRQTYGVHYEAMEKLILQAQTQPMTELQAKRFTAVIGNNMRLMQWRLKKAGYLRAKYSSPYTINGDQVLGLLPEEALSRVRYGPGVTPVQVRVGEAKQANVENIPNPRYVLLYSTQDGAVRLTPKNVLPGSSYLFYYLLNEKDQVISRGMFDTDREITLNAKANTPYYLVVIDSGVTLNPQIKWDLAIPGATPAQASFENGTVYLNPSKTDKTPSLYVYVPESLNRVANNTDDGVLIETLTSERQKTQERRYASRAAQAALDIALTKYQGSLIQNLDSGWKFTTDADKTGLETGFAKMEFNDRSWAPISAIGPWQSHGFEKYHGTGWYRKTFTLNAADIDPTWLGDKKVLLFVGAVDGDAVFYLNGRKIAERKQADYVDSWLVPFALDVTSPAIAGRNTLAVQVTKEKFASGLYKGVSLIAGVPEKQ